MPAAIPLPNMQRPALPCTMWRGCWSTRMLVEGFIFDRDHAVARTWHIWRAGPWHGIIDRTMAPLLKPGTPVCRVTPVAIRDDVRVQFKLSGMDGGDSAAIGRLPRWANLRVSWKRFTLTAAVTRETIMLKVPA